MYAGDKTAKNLSLMINVYWGTEYLENMLKTLDKYNVKTTFFVGGYWVAQNDKLLSEIYDETYPFEE